VLEVASLWLASYFITQKSLVLYVPLPGTSMKPVGQAESVDEPVAVVATAGAELSVAE